MNFLLDLLWLRRFPCSNQAPAPHPNKRTSGFVNDFKGELPIDGRIDLHGLTANPGTTSIFASFLPNIFISGSRCLLIITGKAEIPNRADGRHFKAISDRLDQCACLCAAYPDLPACSAPYGRNGAF